MSTHFVRPSIRCFSSYDDMSLKRRVACPLVRSKSFHLCSSEGKSPLPSSKHIHVRTNTLEALFRLLLFCSICHRNTSHIIASADLYWLAVAIPVTHLSKSKPMYFLNLLSVKLSLCVILCLFTICFRTFPYISFYNPRLVIT